MKIRIRLRVALAFSAICSISVADVKLPPIFGHHMALQQGVPVPVWGTAEPGEEVAVTVAQRHASAKAGTDGKWKVSLPPLAAGGPFIMTVAGHNTLTFTNIVAGEVWLCSGQSNMEQQSGMNWGPPITNIEKEIAAATWPQIRFFTVKKATSLKPLDDVVGEWSVCTPEAMKAFSAVGYFFGRDLHQKLGVPVGLICSSVGATPAQGWTRREMQETDPEMKKTIEEWERRTANYAAEKKSYEGIVERWEQAVAKAEAEKKSLAERQRIGGRPVWWNDPINSPHRPGNLYNGMIAPLIPYAIHGVIWYQGESNANFPDLYARLFPTLIQDWRKQWGQGDFPFLFVQLANFMARAMEPTDSNWARLREAQFKALRLPNTGMAVGIDIGDANNIHPLNKPEFGRRLALSALSTVYGKTDVVPYGPLFDRMTVEGDHVRLVFTQLGGGLAPKPEGSLKGFAVAGDDRKFVWAEAKIDGDTVIVSSEAVKQPVAVRYGWADNPEVSLSNKAGLPASPFRTDDWPYAPPAPPPAVAKPTAPPTSSVPTK